MPRPGSTGSTSIPPRSGSTGCGSSTPRGCSASPGFRRFRGYEVGPLILIKRPLAEVSDDLIVHELCHVWQDQHRRWRMWTSYLYQGYRNNPHEVEARRAAAETR